MPLILPACVESKLELARRDPCLANPAPDRNLLSDQVKRVELAPCLIQREEVCLSVDVLQALVCNMLALLRVISEHGMYALARAREPAC